MEKPLDWTYCVVGNITKTHIDESGILRYGTSAFSGGTKVYICGRIWDKTKKHIDALGLTRGGHLQTIETDIDQIENLRLQKVFKPSILRMMDDHEYRSSWWGKSKKEKADAEAFIHWWNNYKWWEQ